MNTGSLFLDQYASILSGLSQALESTDQLLIEGEAPDFKNLLEGLKAGVDNPISVSEDLSVIDGVNMALAGEQWVALTDESFEAVDIPMVSVDSGEYLPVSVEHSAMDDMPLVGAAVESGSPVMMDLSEHPLASLDMEVEWSIGTAHDDDAATKKVDTPDWIEPTVGMPVDPVASSIQATSMANASLPSVAVNGDPKLQAEARPSSGGQLSPSASLHQSSAHSPSTASSENSGSRVAHPVIPASHSMDQGNQSVLQVGDSMPFESNEATVQGTLSKDSRLDAASVRDSGLQPMIKAETLPLLKTELPAQPVVMTPQVRESLVQMVRLMHQGNGLGEAEIQLDPPELGSLMIKLKMESTQGAQLTFHTQHSAVRDMLQDNVARLRESLDAMGVELTDVTVDVGSGQDSPSQDDLDPFFTDGGHGFVENVDNEAELEGVDAVVEHSVGLIDERV